MTFLYMALLVPVLWAQSPESSGEGDEGSEQPSQSDESSATPSEKDGRPEGVESLMKNGVFIGNGLDADEEKEKSKEKTQDNATVNPNTTSTDAPVKKMPPNPIKGGELVIQYDDSEAYNAEQKWLQENLNRYLNAAAFVVIGEIMDQRPLRSNSGKGY